MKHILICGLGSIGRRHLRHFRKIGLGRIDAFRSGKATLSDDNQPSPDRSFASLEEAIAQHPQAAIITNPTSLHLETALSLVKAGISVLIEKPLSHNLQGCEEMLATAKSTGARVAVACNLRFHPLLKRVKTIVADKTFGRVVNASAHFGAYLPDWHPWEDYKKGYAGRRDLGGGAALTHIHELDYLSWILGPIEQALSLESQLHPIGTDVDEYRAMLLRHSNGTLSQVSLSLCQKPASRQLSVYFEKGYLTLNLLTDQLLTHTPDGPQSEGPPTGFSMDETYRSQALEFVKFCSTGELGDLCSGAQGLESLKTLQATGAVE